MCVWWCAGSCCAAGQGGQAHCEALFHRVNGEFMVLGFLAFLVWSINQGDGFGKLKANVITMAPDGVTLLHLCEAVHMYLFLAMILNFTACGFIVFRICRWQTLIATYENPELANDEYIKEHMVEPPSFLRGRGGCSWACILDWNCCCFPDHGGELPLGFRADPVSWQV